MWKKARALSSVELEYLKSHKDYPINQLCIALSNTKNQVKKALAELGNKKGKAKKALPGNKVHRSNIGKRADLNNQFFRSSWEANFYRYLKYTTGKSVLIEYEPTDFSFAPFGIIKGPAVSYTPDFKVTYTDEYGNKTYEWIEIKGYIKPADRTKLKRLKKYFPDEFAKLKGVTGSENVEASKVLKDLGIPIKCYYNDLKKAYKNVILHWES